MAKKNRKKTNSFSNPKDAPCPFPFDSYELQREGTLITQARSDYSCFFIFDDGSFCGLAGWVSRIRANSGYVDPFVYGIYYFSAFTKHVRGGNMFT